MLLKLLQEMPMTIALSSRLTCVRARWRAARDSTGSLPARPAHSNAPAAPADCWMATVAKVGEVRGRRGSSGQAAALGAPLRPRCALAPSHERRPW